LRGQSHIRQFIFPAEPLLANREKELRQGHFTAAIKPNCVAEVVDECRPREKIRLFDTTELNGQLEVIAGPRSECAVGRRQQSSFGQWPTANLQRERPQRNSKVKRQPPKRRRDGHAFAEVEHFFDGAATEGESFGRKHPELDLERSRGRMSWN
jgi:hypothetical protein